MEEYGGLQMKKILQEVWRFLGLKMLPLGVAQPIFELNKLIVSKSPLSEMKLTTRKLLENFFSKSNMKLSRMLNRRKFLWLD